MLGGAVETGIATSTAAGMIGGVPGRGVLGGDGAEATAASRRRLASSATTLAVSMMMLSVSSTFMVVVVVLCGAA